MSNEKKTIVFDSVGKAFFYTGYIIEEKKDFLVFEDDKIGIIELRRENIISVKNAEKK